MFMSGCACCGDGFTPCDVCSGTLTPNNQIAIEATVSITNSAGARLSTGGGYSCSDPRTVCASFASFPSYLICTRPVYSSAPPACTFLAPCAYSYMTWLCGPYSFSASSRIGGAIHSAGVLLLGGGSSKYWSVHLYAGDAFDYVRAGLGSCQWQENTATSAYCSGDGASFGYAAAEYTSSTFSSCTPAASYNLTTSTSPLTINTPWGEVVFPSSLTLYTL